MSRDLYQRFYDLAGGDVTKHLDGCEEFNANPDLDLLVTLRGELTDADDTAGRRAIDKAAEALATGDMRKIAWAFYLMGEMAERARHPSPDEALAGAKFQFVGAKLQFVEFKRRRPLEIKSGAQASMREAVQDRAKALWALPEHAETRVGAMAALLEPAVGAAIAGLCLQRARNVPLSPSTKTLTDWVRDAAPEFAKKAGRPRKE